MGTSGEMAGAGPRSPGVRGRPGQAPKENETGTDSREKSEANQRLLPMVLNSLEILVARLRWAATAARAKTAAIMAYSMRSAPHSSLRKIRNSSFARFLVLLLSGPHRLLRGSCLQAAPRWY